MIFNEHLISCTNKIGLPIIKKILESEVRIMKPRTKSLFILIFIIFKPLYSTSYVSYSGSGGRLGDNLVALMHAAYAAYTNDVELIYTPFDYFEQLALSHKLRHVDHIMQDYRPTVKRFNPGEHLIINPNSDILYVVPYFPEGDWERIHCDCFKFECDWNNKGFLTYIRNLITPLNPQPAPNLDPAQLNIAVHIRRGGGVDSPLYSKFARIRTYSDVGYPLKFPPLRYYIGQLQKIFTSFASRSIHVHIFSDEQNPQELIDRIKTQVTYRDVTFSCRTTHNSPHLNVLEDLFAMPHYDILIRGTSNYAITADKLNDYLVVICPLIFEWHGDTLYIPQQKLRLNTSHPKYAWIADTIEQFTPQFTETEIVAW